MKFQNPKSKLQGNFKFQISTISPSQLVNPARFGSAAVLCRFLTGALTTFRATATLTSVFIALAWCTAFSAQPDVHLITLDPGHFHASLVQKSMYPDVSPVVHVYAPAGPDLQAHLQRIKDFNERTNEPTHWEEKVYSKPDFLERMLRDKPGNVVVIAGNNTRKTDYIKCCVDAGLNVLGDKPMAINPADFEILRAAFDEAKKNKVLLYDIMTERFEITSILVGELMRERGLFGKLQKGSSENPAVVMDSVHYFYKEVAGKPLIRPAWFFDVRQEGEAIPDVGTHLVDAVQHHCFPEQALDWKKDIKVLSAKCWATKINSEQFKRSTGLSSFPDFLKKDQNPEGSLEVFANGEVNYTLRGIHAQVIARWAFEAPAGAKDSLYARFCGTGATLLIQQRAQEKFVATVYIESAAKRTPAEFEKALRAAVHNISKEFPGIEVAHSAEGWHLVIPNEYVVGHESHFAQVTERYLDCLRKGKLPAWEVPNMLAKYYTTTEAYRLSHK